MVASLCHFKRQQILNQAIRSAKLPCRQSRGADMIRFDNKVVLVSGGARGQDAAEG
jgi:hypothetical protein